MRVAKSDHLYVVDEIKVIDRVLERTYGIGPVDAAKLRADGERLERTAPETEQFAAKLHEAVDYGARRAIAESLWQVVMADGISKPEEEAVVLVSETILGVSATDMGATGGA